MLLALAEIVESACVVGFICRFNVCGTHLYHRRVRVPSRHSHGHRRRQSEPSQQDGGQSAA